MGNIFSDIKERLGQFGELFDATKQKLEAQKREAEVKARLEATNKAKQLTPVQSLIPNLTQPKQEQPINIFKDIGQNIIKPIVTPSAELPIQPKSLPIRKEITQEQRTAGQNVVGFGKEILRATPRAAAEVTLALRGEKQFVPGTGIVPGAEKFLFGKEPVESTTEKIKRFPERAKEFGVPEQIAKPLAAPVVIGFTVLDLIPGFPGKSRIVKEIAEEASEAGVKQILKRSFKDIGESEADNLARKLAPIRDRKLVQKELDEFAELRKAGKATEELATGKKAEELAEIKKPRPKIGIPEEIIPTPKLNIFDEIAEKLGIKGKPTPKPEVPPIKPPEVPPKFPPETPKVPEPTPSPSPAIEPPKTPELRPEPIAGREPTVLPKARAGEAIGVLPSEAEAVAKRYPSRLVERKFITSVKKEFPEIGEKIQRVGGQYVPRSTDELAIKARNFIKGDIDAAEQLIRTSADENAVATASELIKHYNEAAQKAGKLNEGIFLDKAADVAHTIAAKLTEQGRSVQAASILSRLTPEGLLRFAASEINKYNEAVLKSRGLLGLKRTVPALTREQTSFILNESKRIQTMADGVEKAMAFRNLNNYIADLIPTSLYKKLVTLWKAGLLTGVKTSGLNTFSNLFHGFSEIVKDIPATMIDSVSSLITGKRTIGFTPKGYLEGVRSGFGKGIRYLRTGFDERDVATKLDYKRVKFGDSRFAKGIQIYTDTVFRVLGAEDQPFYYGAKARSLMSQAVAQAKNARLRGDEAAKFIDNLIQNPTDEMLKYAVLDAETAVFQNRTTLGDIAKAIQRAPGGEVIVPFGRTPSAVATQVLNYTPVGIVKTIMENIGHGKFDQRLFAQGLARGLTGTGILAIGYSMFNNGLITLARPTNEREQKLWELEGKSANSIKVGNKWRSAQTLGPAGNVLLIGGYFAQSMQNEGSPTKAIATAIAGGAKSFTEQTFLRGVNQAVEALTDPERSFENFFTNLSGSTIPTLVADIARSTDVVERRSKGPIERIKTRIPFLRETLEPAITALGGKVPRYGGNVVESLIDPTRPSVIRGDEVIEELRRLWDANQKVSPSLLGNKQGYETLTPEQNTELWEKTGQLIESKLRNLFQLPAYQKLDDEGKGKKVEKIVDKAKDVARAAMVLELTQELSGDQLKSRLSELKKAGLLTQAVYREWLELR